jgi:glutathione synthase/RimK-type ligase-like ATP-grasp enzyme
MEKNKLILVGTHGKPSTREAYVQVEDGKMIHRRRFTSKKTGKLVKYYRIYNNGISDHYTKLKKNKLNLSDSVVLRWGTQEPVETNASSVIYNKISSLKLATDKSVSRHLLNSGGVRVPKIITPENIKEKHLPIICRPHIHSKGKNFIVLKTIEEFNLHYDPNQFYYSKFIDKDKEFRVHVAHGKVLRLLEKENPNNGNLAWNRAANQEAGGFKLVNWNDSDPYFDVLLQAVQAVEILGLDCGGVDVMFKDNKAYVLEVNTAPTLNSCPTTAKKWGLYWNWLFKSNTRRPHFDYTKWKKAKSFFWKNKHFEN